MSGYQISDSWRHESSWWRFCAKATLRLWPPLLFVILITALVIGPLVSTLELAEYFSARNTWGYIVHNAGLYTLKHRLPGVFDHKPWPWSANGSIWTLPMELTGYLLVLGFGVTWLFHRAPWLTIVLMLTLVGLDRRFKATIGDPGHAGSFLQMPIGSLVAFLVAFNIGMVLHTYWAGFRCRLSWRGHWSAFTSQSTTLAPRPWYSPLWPATGRWCWHLIDRLASRATSPGYSAVTACTSGHFPFSNCWSWLDLVPSGRSRRPHCR
jgi:peptidoglycan/LPS O-acetylase OafA/YrhL